MILYHIWLNAGNIGVSREFDQRWVTQYSALFCVLNNDGQVVTWQLAPKVAFAHVEGLLQRLKERLEHQGKHLSQFFIDNCCAWRPNLQRVFGEDLKVYLDLFHAVKRISDKIPKRHSLRYECLKDLRIVFRDPSDRGVRRTLPTPEPDVMLAQLDAFAERWKNAHYNGVNVLKPAAEKEITNLKKHIIKGCLAGILPGRGTSRNEVLHKNINKIVTSSRYGVELAYALLSTIFFEHNEKQFSLRAKIIPRPIELCVKSPLPTFSSNERFGLCFAEGTAVDSPREDPGLPLLDLRKCGYQTILSRLTAEESYPVRKHALDFIPDSEQSRPSETAANSDCDAPEDDESDTTLPLAVLKGVLLSAISLHYIYRNVSNYSTTAVVNKTSMPFMNSLLGDLFTNHAGTVETDSMKHDKRLKDVLRSWNFVQKRVPGDGDCLFRAMVKSLTLHACSNMALSATLSQLEIDMSSDLEDDIIKKLRIAVVQEWLGENMHEYQSFLSSQQLHAEAAKFTTHGVFSGEVGDLMVRALSNVLHTPIVLFTSAPDMPIIVTTPSHVHVTNTHPIHLTFNMFGPGHYDLAVFNEVLSDKSSLVYTNSFCLCASKRMTKGTPCSQSTSYSTRCPCYNTKSPMAEATMNL